MTDDAPVVSHPVGRTPRLAAALVGLWLLGAASACWIMVVARPSVDSAFMAAVLMASLVLSGVACVAFWRGQSPRSLLWDGERWHLRPEDEPMDDTTGVQVRLDLQRAMLLRLASVSARRPTWLWAEAAHDPARWHLLRCALYSSARSVSAETAPDADERA